MLPVQAQVDKLEGLALAEQLRIQSLQEERLNLEVNLEIPIPLKMGQVRLSGPAYHSLPELQDAQCRHHL